MTITVNFRQQPAPGYEPRRAITLHNVASVHDKGPRAVEVHMEFSDMQPTYDHVASVGLTPTAEDETS